MAQVGEISMSAEEKCTNASNESSGDDVGQVLCKFYLENKCRFGDECRNLHEGSPINKDKYQQPSGNKVMLGNEIDDRNRNSTSKKRPMKTATDVISRILWDERLPADKFVVGYLDRFVGVIERAFTAFSWEDISSVDYDTLAIPRHRIQYFKYRSHKVWDKAERLDLIFGSTGIDGDSGDIYDVMRQWDDAGGEDSDAADTLMPDAGAGRLESVETQRRDIAGCAEERQRATHFLAFRVTDGDVLGEAARLCEHIGVMEPQLVPTVSKPCRLHLTVCMLVLRSPQEIADAVRALEQLRYHVTPDEPLTLELRGVGHFGNRVIYLQPADNQQLRDYIRAVQNYLHREGVSVISDFEFVPHVTLLKMSRLQAREMNSRLIDPSVYQKYVDRNFGAQPLQHLCLCPVGERRDEEGFYRILTQVAINCDK